jgi:hypothetical protein
MSHLVFLAVIGLLACIQSVAGMAGFDISLQMCNSDFYTSTYWNCFRNNGYGFSVIQAAQGGNGMTSKISQCVAQAHNAGFAVSLYGWFCPYCRNQADAYSTGYNTIMNLKNQGLYPGSNYTYFYVDVEECDPDDDCFSRTPSVNQQYILDIVRGIQDAGASAAIYASPYEWNLLMGSSAWKDSRLYSLPLWYANWNNRADMSGFSAFGGWNEPHMHQFADSCSTCYNVDQDFIY